VRSAGKGMILHFEASCVDIEFCGTTGHKIPAIENLGVAGVSDFLQFWHWLSYEDPDDLNALEQPHDAIDFTDNDIQIVGNFPLSPRLRTLLLARNRISGIQPTLANSIPNLTTLVLTSNNVAELADLDTLGKFRNLTHLILVDNPVTRKEVW
jgi:U2 small nuclear ribonucleoprotein A'